MRKSPRDRRLESDFRAVVELSRQSKILAFDAKGNPPQRYRFNFRGLGFWRAENGDILVRDDHQVVVELGAAYPRMVPNLAWQTPIYHPNISNNGVVCLGGYGTHWVPSLTLDELCSMLWDMIRYKNFDTESPYNREAALWAKTQDTYQFPIDGRSIRDASASQPPKMNSQVRNDSQSLVIETGIEIVERRDPEGTGIVFLD